MVQRRGCFGLAVETIARHRIGGNPIREQLQRHEAVEAALFRLVDDTHAALAQDAEKPVVRNGAVRHGQSGL
jgi:hypothetical protein